MERITVIVEHAEGKIKPVSYEAVACALRLREEIGVAPRLAILGENVLPLAEELSEKTGLTVTALEAPGLSLYNGEAYKEILQGQLRQDGLHLILVPHTSQGADFAPGLAVRLKGSCLTSVVRVTSEAGGLAFMRPVFNGKVVAEMVSAASTTVVTVAPGAFLPPPLPGGHRKDVELRTLPPFSGKTRSLGTEKAAGGDSSLGDADVIVAAGRGIRNLDNLPLIAKLAELFPRSAVAGSRPLCDLGWLEYRQQVGVTGNTVAPKLYIACGISGAAQHLSGMSGSAFVVSINTDPYAAIFNHSDVCVVEDLTSFIPILIAEHQKDAPA